MKDRWQKSLETAVETYNTELPWQRGSMRAMMVEARRRQHETAKARRISAAA